MRLPETSRTAPLLAAVAALAATTVVAGVSLQLGGFDPLAAAGAMFRGALGGKSALLSITLVRSP